MEGYWLLVAHLCGDYALQSDFMALEKTKRAWAALLHAFTYTLPFLFITQKPLALALIAGTHFVIDHWRLARYICWLKNFIAPKETFGEIEVLTTATPTFGDWDVQQGDFIQWNGSEYRIETTSSACAYTMSKRTKWRHKWADCDVTGYPKDRPAWLTVWLLIIVDNTAHLICNGLIVTHLG